MIAFTCSSPVQIMRAIQIKTTSKYFSDDADLFVVNMFKGARDVVSNLSGLDIFNNVELIELSELNKPLFALVYNGNELKQFKSTSYEKLVAFNVGGKQIDALYNLNKKNSKFEYHCVEDGPAIYRIPEYPAYPFYHPNRILGLDHAYFHMKYWWTSCPEFIEVPECYHTEKKYLPPIDYRNDELVSLINAAFGYQEDQQLAETDVLIMDESHYQDGLMIDDADYHMYARIAERYKGIKFLMKMHPRTQHNRYEGLFPIMKNSGIPWEVYVMNRAREESKPLIQISVSCSTMLSDKLMFGYEGPKIFMAPLFYDKIRHSNDNAPRVCPENTENIEKFRKTYANPGQFIITYSEQELYGALDRLIGKKDEALA